MWNILDKVVIWVIGERDYFKIVVELSKVYDFDIVCVIDYGSKVMNLIVFIKKNIVLFFICELFVWF